MNICFLLIINAWKVLHMTNAFFSAYLISLFSLSYLHLNSEWSESHMFICIHYSVWGSLVHAEGTAPLPGK